MSSSQEQFHCKQVNPATSLSGAPAAWFLLASFLLSKVLTRGKHLENHLKLITQLEKSIGINYSKNLSDGKQYFLPHWVSEGVGIQ